MRSSVRRTNDDNAASRSPETGSDTAGHENHGSRRFRARNGAFLRGSRLGLVILSSIVGGFAGLGAAGFRWLIYGLTWLFTGHAQFGQQGRVASLHLSFLGPWFLLVIPMVGGLLYGPLIQRFAREARGHGVPEVMIAVAENGGRIRPQVTVVKALASALTIASGGSVGREGPIVQIGSALASSLGQAVRMSESRLKILVACGAAGGISATFNAPITGVFFGFELILREFSVDALFAIILSSVCADIVGQAILGSQPFFGQLPHDLVLHHAAEYLLIATLGVVSGLIGMAFKTILYRIEDLSDAVWKPRPEWLRPVVGGFVLGALLLALPQMYGVGYPVMDSVLGGHVVLWLMLILMVAKMVASSLSIGIGGSGGVFAPSLFIGAMGGTAFGEVARHIFGSGIGSPVLYGVVAMGAVFGSASQAPLTSIASVLEMTGNFGLALPVMLAVGISSGIARFMSYGTIYTTKLLRRGIDIERVRPENVLQRLRVGDVMQEIADGGRELMIPALDGVVENQEDVESWVHYETGSQFVVRAAQVVFEDETLENALHQLALYGVDGLPVASVDRERFVGWITSDDVLSALADQVQPKRADVESGALEKVRADGTLGEEEPKPPIIGFSVIEVPVMVSSRLLTQTWNEVVWPQGWVPVAVARRRKVATLKRDTRLESGDRVVVLARSLEHEQQPPA